MLYNILKSKIFLFFMVNLDKPYTYENSSNPWIMDRKDTTNIIEIDGNKYTAEYLWSLNTEERETALQNVFNYYREKGFPYETYSDEHIVKQFKKFIKYNSSDIITDDGFVSNSGTMCLDLCRHFCKEFFWNASSEKTRSIKSIFDDDEAFIKVLKNRMGWNTSTEDGVERPYLFGISDTMIRTGIRNSGNGYGVSNFRPAIAKFFYERYLSHITDYTPTILDYSGGWGARALAAASLKYNYIGIDPLTHSCINSIFAFLRDKKLVPDTYQGVCYNSGSESSELFKNEIKENTVDLAFSCPPYFNLEVYSDAETQSYNEYDKFNDWIELYWRPTVKNCKYSLKPNHKFVLIIKDFYGNLPLKDEMERVILEEGFEHYETYQYKTTTNHLSSKKKTGKTTKNSEYVLTYTNIK